MPATVLLVDEEGEGQPAPPGEDAVGQAGKGKPYRHAPVRGRGVDRASGGPRAGGASRSREVIGYLDALAERDEREGKPVVVVLDNAPFHNAGAVRDARAGWEARGIRLSYLPAYCPHLNAIEGVWRRLKGFLAAPVPRLVGGAEAGRTERPEPPWSRRDPVLAWRYLA